MNDPQEPPTDPAEHSGELITAIRRNGNTELRVELARYRGHPYVNARV